MKNFEEKQIWYEIFTLCTRGYRDAYEFSIDSWLNNTEVKKIYIYTDDKSWKIDHPRISLISNLDKTDDWLKIVKLKTKVFKQYLDISKTNNSIFIDIDCYIREDIGHVFEEDFDIGVTRLKQPQIEVSTGIVFIKNNRNSKFKSFLQNWEDNQNSLDSKYKVRPRTCSNNQKAFSILIRKCNSSKIFNILDLDVDIYNRKAKPGRIQDLIEQEKNGKKIKVLHFYNTSYRNKEYVNQIFKELNI